jgi:hypothetical protein
MTISLGILCKNGVVLASDGMASLNLQFSSGESYNFMGLDNLKVHIVNNKFICAFAGDDAIMKHFVTSLEQYLSEKWLPSKDPNVLVGQVCSSFIKYYHKIHDSYPEELKAKILKDFDTKIENGSLAILLGFYIGNNFYLYQTERNLQFSIVREGCTWYKIIGSGWFVGNPCISLINELLNVKSMPSVDEALIIAHWTIQHTIDSSSGGVGRDVTIAFLKKDNNGFTIDYCDVADYREHLIHLYNHIHSFTKDINEIVKDGRIEEIPKL